ncbi:MAG: AmmeMemoRadiSam system protein B [Armatimonadetes bacterium]|jgi:AmmeMemoRadiSam system protein B|nr:AmmeMemoRadiSam system protein B [Armatimonadota bacterium]
MSTRFPALRRPAVAGMFYPADPDALRAQVSECFARPPGPGEIPAVAESGPRELLGLVCPHAGLIYSGYAAAHAYRALALDGPLEVAVILCPNHHGMGADNAVWPEGAWQTPLGPVPVDAALATAIQEACGLVTPDVLPHLNEHAVEVQLPFLQLLYGPSLAIVPIAMKHYSLPDCVALGEAIAEACRERRAVIIASSDFSHYESAARARAQDRYALDAIARLDGEALFEVVREHRITTCGYGPVAAMLAAARRLGARRSETLLYTTSGDITGDDSRVVGYAAVKVCR